MWRSRQRSSDYLEFAAGTLLSARSQQRELFNSQYVQHILDAPTDHITPLKGSKLWQLVVLERWLSLHGL